MNLHDWPRETQPLMEYLRFRFPQYQWKQENHVVYYTAHHSDKGPWLTMAGENILIRIAEAQRWVTEGRKKWWY